MNPTLKHMRGVPIGRRALAYLAAAVALSGAGPGIERFNFAPGAYAARQAVIAKMEAAEARGGREILSFREFVALVNPRYQFYKHCEVLGAVLQRVADGEINRLMIFEPPRHGKSEETSRLFSAYFLYRYPERWVGLASYAADLAYTLSRAAKDNFLAAGGDLRGDAKAVKHWMTGQGGGFWAGGVGGPANGKGWHLGILDDLLKNAEQAASAKIRAKHQEWYQSVFSTREEPEGGALIVIQTRWNEEDLSGWLLATEAGADPDEAQRWHVVNFAAIKEEDEPDGDVPRFPSTCVVEPDWRAVGEALCPERYDVAKLKMIAAQVGSYFWAALFQQRPRARDGGTFQREWFKVVKAIPSVCKLVRYWDKARTQGGGDWSVGTLMGRFDDAETKLSRFYVIDVVRGQWSAGNRDAVIRQTAEADLAAYGENVTIWVEQEPGKAGKEATLATIKTLAGFTVYADAVSKDKETRAEPFSIQAEARNVFLLFGAWIAVYLNELTAFPNAAHDDMVDASSGAFNKLALGRRWEWN